MSKKYLLFSLFATLSSVVSAQIANPYDVKQMTAQDGVKIYGAVRYDNLGAIFTPIGDFNNDGFDDVAISAPGSSSGTIREGEVTVIFGGNNIPGIINRSDINGSNGFIAVGIDDGDVTGADVTGADLNGDGFSDLIIGAPGADKFQPVLASDLSYGELHVVYGRASAMPAEFQLSSLYPEFGGNGSQGFGIRGASQNLLLGQKVDVGDFNNDGRPDLIISATGGPGPVGPPLGIGRFAGVVYLLMGRASNNPFPGFMTSNDIKSQGGTEIYGSDFFDGFGTDLSALGDFNGDGFNDFAVFAFAGDGLNNASAEVGEVTIIHGRSTFPPILDSLNFTSANSTIIYGDTGTYRFRGSSRLGSGGDLDGDGRGDLSLGFPVENVIQVVYGASSGIHQQTISQLRSSQSLLLTARNNDNTDMGLDMTIGGDINNDGNEDYLFGGSTSFGVTGEGYMLYGTGSRRVGTLSTNIVDTNAGVRFFGIPGNFAESIRPAGDVNGDGIDDLIIGAPGASDINAVQGTSSTGQAFIIYGKTAPLPPMPADLIAIY